MKKRFTYLHFFAANFCVYLVTFAVFLIGISFPNWMSHGSQYRWGVFENCTKDTAVNASSSGDWNCRFQGISDTEERFGIISFLVYFGLFSGFFTGVAQLARYLPLCCVFEIYSGFFITTAVYNFGQQIGTGEDVLWACYATAASGVLFFINGFALIAIVNNSGKKLDRSPCKDAPVDDVDPFFQLDISSPDKDLPKEVEA